MDFKREILSDLYVTVGYADVPNMGKFGFSTQSELCLYHVTFFYLNVHSETVIDMLEEIKDMGIEFYAELRSSRFNNSFYWITHLDDDICWTENYDAVEDNYQQLMNKWKTDARIKRT